jgi:hypothetical protein
MQEMSGWSASQRLFFIADVHSGAYWGNLGGLHSDLSFSLVVFLIRSVKSSLLLSSGVNSKSLSAPLSANPSSSEQHSIIMAPLLPKALLLRQQTISAAPSSKRCLFQAIAAQSNTINCSRFCLIFDLSF